MCSAAVGVNIVKTFKMKFNQRARDWLCLSFQYLSNRPAWVFTQTAFTAFIIFRTNCVSIKRIIGRQFFNADRWGDQFLSHLFSRYKHNVSRPNWVAVGLLGQSLRRTWQKKKKCFVFFLCAMKDDRLWQHIEINSCCWIVFYQVVDLWSVLQPHGKCPEDTGWVNGNTRGVQD